jgi:prepilin-type N-terminal cleavage/methylation domain-containing protein
MAMTRTAQHRQQGLTLIETSIALALLGFGLLAIWPMFIGSVKTNASSNQLGSANSLAGKSSRS